MKNSRSIEAQRMYIREETLREKFKAERAKAKAEAEKEYRKGVKLAQEKKFSSARESFERAHKLDPENESYVEAIAQLAERSRVSFPATVVGLPTGKNELDNKVRECTIEFLDRFIRISYQQKEGILLKKMVVEREFSYSTSMKFHEEKTSSAVTVDLFGSGKTIVSIPFHHGHHDDSTQGQQVIKLLRSKIVVAVKEPVPEGPDATPSATP
jgi:hypothetical protein